MGPGGPCWVLDAFTGSRRVFLGMTDLHWSGRVKEVEKDLGGSWRVLDSSRVYGGSTSVKKVSGRVFNIFGGLLWSERVWKDPRGPMRIWEGPGGSWCAWRIWEGL